MRKQARNPAPGRPETGRLRSFLLLSAWLFCAGALSGCGNTADKYELREQGIEAMKTGAYEKALSCFSEALSASAGEVSELQYDVLKYRAECELRLQRFDDAEESYTILQQLDEDPANQKKYQEILEDLDGRKTLTEALTRMEAGAFSEALEALKPLAERKSGMTGRAAWFDYAVCLERLNRYDEAADAFAEYLELYPEDEAAQKELSFLKTR